MNASKMYDMVLNTTVYTLLRTVGLHGQVICILACHAHIMENPESNQHFNVHTNLGRGRGL